MNLFLHEDTTTFQIFPHIITFVGLEDNFHISDSDSDIYFATT